MNAEEFAKRLNQVTVGRKRGKNEYLAECPVCHRRTLRFTDAKRGIGLICYFDPFDPKERCSAKAITAALGLTIYDLAYDVQRARSSQDRMASTT